MIPIPMHQVQEMIKNVKERYHEKNLMFSAFTLIEMLCVLFVVSMISLCSIYGFVGLKNRVEQQVFLQTFENNLAYIHERAIIGENATYIRAKQYFVSIDFPYDGQPEEVLYPPKTLKISDSESITFHHYTGTYGPISSFVFYDKLANRRIIYQLFLGSGRYEKRIE